MAKEGEDIDDRLLGKIVELISKASELGLADALNSNDKEENKRASIVENGESDRLAEDEDLEDDISSEDKKENRRASKVENGDSNRSEDEISEEDGRRDKDIDISEDKINIENRRKQIKTESVTVEEKGKIMKIGRRSNRKVFVE